MDDVFGGYFDYIIEETKKRSKQREEILKGIPHEQYVAVPTIKRGDNGFTGTFWEILLPVGNKEVKRGKLKMSNEVVLFDNQQAAEDLTRAMNIGRSHRWDDSP